MLDFFVSNSSTAFKIIFTLAVVGVCETFPYQYFQRFYYLPHYHTDGYVQGYDCDVPGHVDYSYNLAQDDYLHPQGNFLDDGYWKHHNAIPTASPGQRYSYIGPNGMLYVTGDTSAQRNTFQVSGANPFSPPIGDTGNRNGIPPPRNMNNNQPSGGNRNTSVPNDRRTNQLGIPSAALASLSGGGLG